MLLNPLIDENKNEKRGMAFFLADTTPKPNQCHALWLQQTRRP